MLTFKLKVNKKIITSGKLFKASDFKELNALFEKGIFRSEIYDVIKYRGITIFKLKIIYKIKNKNTLLLYKKLRLII